jgi:uncharacterized protein (TIGR02300 family)
VKPKDVLANRARLYHIVTPRQQQRSLRAGVPGLPPGALTCSGERGMWQAVFGRGVSIVAKPEWGLKRTCQSCGARFYDMGKESIACPKCGTKFDPEVVLKSKRATKAVAEKAAPVAKPKPKPKDDEAEILTDDDAVDAEESESEEEEVIEDTSELGEDDEDVADVIENVDEDEER